MMGTWLSQQNAKLVGTAKLTLWCKLQEHYWPIGYVVNISASVLLVINFYGHLRIVKKHAGNSSFPFLAISINFLFSSV